MSLGYKNINFVALKLNKKEIKSFAEIKHNNPMIDIKIKILYSNKLNFSFFK